MSSPTSEVRWFSRHPAWFRLAVWEALVRERPRVPSTGKRLAPHEAHVIATVVLATDLWGWTWGQSSKWLSAITGVSPERCRLAMKAGVELGVFLRDRIPRGGRFPFRPAGKDGWKVPAVPGEGQDAPFGGYVYRVSHAWTWGLFPTKGRVGDFRIAIRMDRYPGSPSLLTDLALLRRSKIEIPEGDSAVSREVAPAAADRPPETETRNVASETPCAPVAARADAPRPGPASDARAVGAGAGPRGPDAAHGRADAATLEKMRAEMTWAFAAKAPSEAPGRPGKVPGSIPRRQP